MPPGEITGKLWEKLEAVNTFARSASPTFAGQVSGWLGLNLRYGAFAQTLQRGQDARHKWHQVLNGVATTLQHDDSKPPLGNVLLELEALVAGQQRPEPSGFSPT